MDGIRRQTRLDLLSKADLEEDYFLFMPNDVKIKLNYKTNKTELLLYGILPHGGKTVVKILDCECYFDVPQGSVENCHTWWDSKGGSIRPQKVEIIERYPLHGFQPHPLKWARITFKNHIERATALQILKDNNIPSASDDTRHLHRMFARNHGLVLTDWNIIKHCKYHTGVIVVEHIQNIVPIVSPMASFPKQQHMEDVKRERISPCSDKILIMTWDIETYDSSKTGLLPEPQHATSWIFMICLTLHWKYDNTPLCQLCIVDTPCQPSPQWETIVCNDEKGIIMTFADVCGRMQPDIIVGFNDSAYDWPFLIQRAFNKGYLSEFIHTFAGWPPSYQNDEDCYKWHITSSKVKISPSDTVEALFPKIPGVLCVDVRTMLRKMFPQSEKTSLNHFLALCGLAAKNDLSPTDMWAIYESKNPENMAKIASYCIVDALRCQELLLKNNIIDDRREVASLSFVSLYDAIQFADGQKVCNMLYAFAGMRQIVCSSRTTEQKYEKYPGATVFFPKKGLIPDPSKPLSHNRPVGGLDFCSLYPSLIMTYNLSPEKFLKSPQGYDVHTVDFKTEQRQVTGHFVQHKNDLANYGLFPFILQELLFRRNAYKQLMQATAREIEESKKNNESVVDNEFKYNSFNSKQKALKIFMNTFYGEAGNHLSPFFLLPLAGGITAAGRSNINKIADWVCAQGYELRYGDTDSLYLMAPQSIFHQIDSDYETQKMTKQEYWNNMVMLSIKNLKELCSNINIYLQNDNGTTHLKMAFEEVLYPVAFVGKKKYFGVAHTTGPNFNNKLFIRGIEVIKQGQCAFVKQLGYRIMEQAVAITNEKTLLHIVEDELRIALTTNTYQWDDYILSDAWRPTKKNQAVQIFMERMRTNGHVLPTPGSRFSYVLAQKSVYNLSNHKICYRKGDIMEFAGPHIKINTKWYIEHYAIGLCARFINYAFAGTDACAQKAASKHLHTILPPPPAPSQASNDCNRALNRSLRYKTYKQQTHNWVNMIIMEAKQQANNYRGPRYQHSGTDFVQRTEQQLIEALNRIADLYKRTFTQYEDYRKLAILGGGQRPSDDEFTRIATDIHASEGIINDIILRLTAVYIMCDRKTK